MGTGNAAQSQVRDGNAGGRGAGGTTILIVLFDDDAIACDIGKLDALVDNVAGGAGGAGDGFDAYAILRVANAGVFDYDIRHGIVVSTTHRADG